MILYFIGAFVLIGLGFIVLERKFPDQTLEPVPGWWRRVIFMNIAQVGVVFVAGFSWDRWLQSISLFHLNNNLSIPVQVAWGYLVATFVYYVWHRVRHESVFFWQICHQLHHSASRLETITSFYKHPFELIFNSLISSAVSYTVLGLSIKAAIWVTFISGLAEFFYHMNIRTPQWIGYLIQRPEMHRIHHQRGRHYNNFADLPVWDIIFGTFSNPPTYNGRCGFKIDRELQFWEMLKCNNVNSTFKKENMKKVRNKTPSNSISTVTLNG